MRGTWVASSCCRGSNTVSHFQLPSPGRFEPGRLFGAAIVLGVLAAAELVVQIDELVDRFGSSADAGDDGGRQPS